VSVVSEPTKKKPLKNDFVAVLIYRDRTKQSLTLCIYKNISFSSVPPPPNCGINHIITKHKLLIVILKADQGLQLQSFSRTRIYYRLSDKSDRYKFYIKASLAATIFRINPIDTDNIQG
jgi:hypothetical protein